MIIGRFLDGEEIRHLSQKTHLSLALLRAGDPQVPAELATPTFRASLIKPGGAVSGGTKTSDAGLEPAGAADAIGAADSTSRAAVLVSPGNIKELALENLALRQQLTVLKRQYPRPRLRRADRIFWVWLSTVWSHWRQALMIVRPATVVNWHRKGFRLYWSWISRRKRRGRPEVSTEIRALIRRMAQANPFWAAPRIHGELLKLGLEVSERTVSRLMPKRRKPPSQTWRAFLNNHVEQLVSIDFFTVPTATFRVLFALFVLAHHRRRVLHFNVTEHPTALWTGQQVVEAFPEDTAPRYLLRDRDKIYGEDFQERVQGMGITEVKIAPQSPWQSPFAERLVGSVRRECLDHVIVLGRAASTQDLSQLLRLLSAVQNPLVPEQRCSHFPWGSLAR